MKIIYSAGNRVGANYQLQRFLENTEHEVAISAYVNSSITIKNVNWTLDSLFTNKASNTKMSKLSHLLGHKGVPTCNVYNAEVLISEIDAFEPDLIISDGEPFVAHIAKAMNIKLYYCSPLHMLDGIQWEKSQLKYVSLLENTRKMLSKMPDPDNIYVYSTFGDINFRPSLRNGYEWITPYHQKIEKEEPEIDLLCVLNDDDRFGAITKIINSLDLNIGMVSHYNEELSNTINYYLNNYTDALKKSEMIFNFGFTSDVADAFYNSINAIISPSLLDPETLLNAILTQEYNIGYNIGQLEYLERFSLETLESAIATPYKKDFLSLQNYNLIHEVL